MQDIPLTSESSSEQYKLSASESYEVLAIQFPSNGSHAAFWVLGNAYLRRWSYFGVRPDIVSANECRVVDADLPSEWQVDIFKVGPNTSVQVGPKELAIPAILESLLDGDDRARNVFVSYLARLGHSVPA